MVFIVFTVIGTVSHEYGHIVVAKYFGYETSLHYGSMNYYPKGYLQDEDLEAYKTLTEDYRNIEYENWPNEVKEKASEYINTLEERYWNEKSNKGLFITIGGPSQTILTGIIGLIILFLRRKSIQIKGLKIIDWLAIFFGLFWLREIFNLIHSFASELISPSGKWFGGDEYYISNDLNLWSGTIPIILGVIGLLVSVYIVFKIVPKNLRLTFILSGLLGGISGFIIWMNIIGPKILP
ncbi:hypothetical protein [Mesohalobacter salilacus]|uniref:hypothetical protein n=1 Tax=Mesohalobacter salilacus TaxID=2491711 RepID=UPI00267E8819